jgi:hypothetical protein
MRVLSNRGLILRIEDKEIEVKVEELILGQLWT